MSHSKRFVGLKKSFDAKKLYPLPEAVALVKKMSNVKFDATVELHLSLGIDVKKSDQQVRGTLLFQHSVGKTKRVAAFVSAEKNEEAQQAGADLYGGEELINEIAQSKKIDFNVAVATPDMMPKLAKVAKILGPAGLMPNPKTDTIGMNVKKMIEEMKRGKIAFKNDATGNIHQAVGKVSMNDAAIAQNAAALLDAVQKAKPASTKGTYIRSATLTSTMGPGIKLDLAQISSSILAA